MTDNNRKTGVLIVSHGSPRDEANAGFCTMVDHVAARAEGLIVKPAFFSIARPTIADRIDEFVAEGITKIHLMPYFLYNGQHVRVDIPEQIAKCRAVHPQADIDVMPTLQGDPMMEELILDRILVCRPSIPALPVTPEEISAKSASIIDRRLGPDNGNTFARAVLRRVIHSTADFSFNASLKIHPDAERVSQELFRSGCNIVCDVKMVAAGITKAAGCGVYCAISDEDVASDAKKQGCTRSAAAMDKLAEKYENGIVAIGNAPTALWRVMEIAERGGPRPALIVGVPVGFVGALESKQALFESGLCYVTNLSNRGGSPVAASVINAMAIYGSK